ncbi:hypothetical protein [Clostridium butyricum]|uniref:hypothetical protein n=1 Tax=Clostridium butyricum TaxID=1492 RepID=UPI00325AFC3A
MCKYCEGQNREPLMKNCNGNYFVCINHCNFLEDSVIGNSVNYSLFGEQINYCPMCGKNLSESEKHTWINCDGDLVRIGLKLDNGVFKLNCTARGNEGEIYAYRKNDWGQFEYCILEDHKYKWINDNGYCKFYRKEVIK